MPFSATASWLRGDMCARPDRAVLGTRCFIHFHGGRPAGCQPLHALQSVPRQCAFSSLTTCSDPARMPRPTTRHTPNSSSFRTMTMTTMMSASQSGPIRRLPQNRRRTQNCTVPVHDLYAAHSRQVFRAYSHSISIFDSIVISTTQSHHRCHNDRRRHRH